MKKLFLFLLLTHFSFLISYAQWIRMQSGTNLTLHGVFFINQNTGIVVGYSGIILKTTNSGVNWIQQTYADTSKLNAIYMLNANTGIVVGWEGIIVRTTNGGINWIKMTSPATGELFDIHLINENTGYIVGDQVLKTTNCGINWTLMINVPYSGINTLYDITFFDMNTGFIVGYPYTTGISTIIRTTNGGENWQISGGIPGLCDILYGVSFIDLNTVVIVGSSLIFRSTNCGNTWYYQLTEGSALFKTVFTNLNTGYAVGYHRRIIKTTNAGINWTVQSSGTNYSLNLWSVSFLDSINGFTVGDSGAIYKTTNGGASDIESKNVKLPNDFYLYQNYPNPFNPVTKIKFDIPNSENGKWKMEERLVTLKIYNIQGKEITTLVKEKLQPGTYEIPFSINQFPSYHLSSGVYFYQLSTRNFKQTKKFIILK